MAPDEPPSHSSTLFYNSNDTTPPPPYSENDVDLGSLQQPQFACSMLDVGVGLQQTSRPIPNAQYVRSPGFVRRARLASRLERTREILPDESMFDISEPPHQRVQSLDIREGSRQPSPQPLQQSRTFRSMLDVGDEFRQSQPTVPSQQRQEDPLDLEAGQEIVKEHEQNAPTMQRRVVIVTTLCTELGLIGLFFVLWITMQQEISKLLWFPILAGSPYFLLIVGLSRSRRHDPKFRSSFIIKTILITLFHCGCGLAMAIFGAWIQCKYDVF